ncbi:MAG: hypothetical protein LBT15_07585, partial [Synergistaceae bacterium]|nr:hypothetical protein [Synergistaceae bacterium]
SPSEHNKRQLSDRSGRGSSLHTHHHDNLTGNDPFEPQHTLRLAFKIYNLNMFYKFYMPM